MAGFGSFSALIVGRPLVIPPELLARYPELGEARYRRGGIPVRVGGWALGRSTVAAITLGRTVFVAAGARIEPALLLHELGHVRQFEASRSFPVRYLWESLRRGYSGNRFELDATQYATARLRAARGDAPGTVAGTMRPPAEDV